MTPAAVRDDLLCALELAAPQSGDPWGVLSKAFQEVLNRAHGEAVPRLADTLVRASQEAVRNVLWSALTSTKRVVEDRERIVGLLSDAALSRGGRQTKSVQSLDEPMATLFRAFEEAALALSSSAIASNLLANVFKETESAAYVNDFEQLLAIFPQVLSSLDDPEVEADVIFEACIDAILDGNDPGDTVDALVRTTRDAIANAEDPEAAIEVFLGGLSEDPAGWPPPTPAWLMPQ